MMYIDNRGTPGVDDETMVRLGYPAGAGRGVYESATYTCGHCNAIVVIEPKRTRERGYCRHCSQRICDPCVALKALTLECKTMARTIDETLEAAAKQVDSTNPIVLSK